MIYSTRTFWPYCIGGIRYALDMDRCMEYRELHLGVCSITKGIFSCTLSGSEDASGHHDLHHYHLKFLARTSLHQRYCMTYLAHDLIDSMQHIVLGMIHIDNVVNHVVHRPHRNRRRGPSMLSQPAFSRFRLIGAIIRSPGPPKRLLASRSQAMRLPSPANNKKRCDIIIIII